VVLEGLTELRTALRNLPADLTQEAGAIVLAHAEEAKGLMQRAYPEGPTGNLRRGVVVDRGAARTVYGAKAIVRSRAAHAHLFEYGTKARETKKGWKRGRMPVGPESQRFVPIAIKVRARMVRALIELVRRAGFQVAA
jgi:hypothetical protein